MWSKTNQDDCFNSPQSLSQYISITTIIIFKNVFGLNQITTKIVRGKTYFIKYTFLHIMNHNVYVLVFRCML